MLGKVVSIGSIMLFVFLVGFAYPLLTTHQVTMTIADKFIDTGTKNSGSFYLVRSTNNQFVELDRAWYNFTDNIDLLYANAQKGRTVTYECFGWNIQGWYWYPNCYKEIGE